MQNIANRHLQVLWKVTKVELFLVCVFAYLHERKWRRHYRRPSCTPSAVRMFVLKPIWTKFKGMIQRKLQIEESAVLTSFQNIPSTTGYKCHWFFGSSAYRFWFLASAFSFLPTNSLFCQLVRKNASCTLLSSSKSPLIFSNTRCVWCRRLVVFILFLLKVKCCLMTISGSVNVLLHQ